MKRLIGCIALVLMLSGCVMSKEAYILKDRLTRDSIEDLALAHSEFKAVAERTLSMEASRNYGIINRDYERALEVLRNAEGGSQLTPEAVMILTQARDTAKAATREKLDHLAMSMSATAQKILNGGLAIRELSSIERHAEDARRNLAFGIFSDVLASASILATILEEQAEAENEETEEEFEEIAETEPDLIP